MNRFQVCIPGVSAPYETAAGTADDALRDALLFYGLTFVPPGTTVTQLAGRNS